ncbi:MAG: beta-propeller fold lactonase family protein, partial [Pseudomonadota bacterium]
RVHGVVIMSRYRIVISAVLLAVSALSFARIEAPDHVIYGSATVFGAPAAPGQLIELQLLATGEIITSYELGRDPRLGDQFALRVPMDAVNPRLDGRARPGDPVQIFLAGQLAAETTIGEEGIAVRLDIDPQNLGTGPSLAITDVTEFEGNAGTVAVTFDVSLNTTSDSDVVMFWQTQDLDATGGASCGAGIDYISDTDTLVFSPGQTEGSINLLICGDTVIEDAEQFELRITGVQNGVPERNAAIGTIIDDDNVPNLLIADVSVIEPTQGSTIDAVFVPTLTQNSDFETRFNYTTMPVNAVPNVDYIPVSGTATIPAGDLDVEIPVTVLNAPNATPPKSFFLVISNPFNVIVDDDQALGVINDRAFRPAVNPEQDIVNQQNNVTGLAGPTSLALSPDGDFAYVTSESLDTLLVFERNTGSGQLTLMTSYDSSRAGFESMLLGAPMDVRVSPDGLHVYVASRTDNSVAVFSRDQGNGTLTFIQNQAEGEMSTPSSSAPNSGLEGVRQLLISADGVNVYAAGADSNGVAVFARNPATGELTFVESERSGVDDPSDPGAAVESMNRPSGLAESPDGEQVYVASRFGNSVQVFDRDTNSGGADFGRLSFITTYEDGLAGITGLEGAYDIAISPDGLHVYVSAEAGNNITLFDRQSNGELELRSVIAQAIPELPGLGGPQGLTVSPDGLEVFVTGFADSSLTIFRRLQEPEDDLQPGDLVVRQTVFDDQGLVLRQNYRGSSGRYRFIAFG